MNLQQRIRIFKELGNYMRSDAGPWLESRNKAAWANSWFHPLFIDRAIQQIADRYLQEGPLNSFVAAYPAIREERVPREVGLVMAGNIPLVGFHDFLSIFLSGHRQRIKPSAKDEVLIRHLVNWMQDRDPDCKAYVSFADRLTGSDAYIATGSDNSARYFEQYFGAYPHIIRKNRTSVAVLDGSETDAEIDGLADDIQTYFGLGCRNVTQLMVPAGYDFLPLLEALKKYDWCMEAHKYRHNYDYNLAIAMINHQFYMTNGSILLIENEQPFSPIAQVHYQTYDSLPDIETFIDSQKIQAVVGHGHLPFGKAQCPELPDFADGVDTMAFLLTI